MVRAFERAPSRSCAAPDDGTGRPRVRRAALRRRQPGRQARRRISRGLRVTLTMKVFLGLTDLCGYYSQLESGLRGAGVDCVFVNAFPESRDYRRTTRPDVLGRLVEFLGRRRCAAPRGGLRRLLW